MMVVIQFALMSVMLSHTYGYTFKVPGTVFKMPTLKSSVTTISRIKTLEDRQTKTEKVMEDIKTELSAFKQNISDLQLISEDTTISSTDLHGLVKQDEFDSLNVTVAALEKALIDLKKKEELDLGTDRTSDSSSNPGSCSSIPGFVALSPSLCVKVSVKGDERTWTDSRVVCQGYGGDLATFQTKDENQKALDHLKSLGIWAESRRVRVWVGFRKVTTTYDWISDSTYGGLWGLYQPKNYDSMKCIGLVQDGLSNSVCVLPERYLCQIPK